jgi:mRNA-degrading endonuclease HigB of HigAB toxin-antitoxin module
MSSILEAAEDFKQKATLLTNNLCQVANVHFSDPERNIRLRELFGKQKEHALNADWTFCLHGAECRFTNNITGQTLEVIMTNGTEMGVLDPYFLYVYCDTTKVFKNLATTYKDNVQGLETELINLFQEGRLRKVDNIETGLRRSLSA